MPQKELIHEVSSHEQGRVDLILAGLTTFSRARVRGLMLHGGVKINGELSGDAGFLVKEGDQLTISYDPIRQYRDTPKNPILPAKASTKSSSQKSFHVIFQDETLVVVHKEAGLLTVPTDKRESQNLIDLLSRHIHPSGRRKLTLVHRLDRDTSGILVFGQNQDAADRLIKQFAGRKPERIYSAIVKGLLKEDSGTIESHLESDKALNQKSNQKGRGELAITHYEVVTRYKSATHIKVKLETGRRNQIRVHFAELGHPVLGDVRYQAEQAQHRHWPYRRLALHARVLGFEHPLSGETLRFEQDLPKEFLQFEKSQRN